jgi:hypothetical protein
MPRDPEVNHSFVLAIGVVFTPETTTPQRHKSLHPTRQDDLADGALVTPAEPPRHLQLDHDMLAETRTPL